MLLTGISYTNKQSIKSSRPHGQGLVQIAIVKKKAEEGIEPNLGLERRLIIAESLESLKNKDKKYEVIQFPTDGVQLLDEVDKLSTEPEKTGNPDQLPLSQHLPNISRWHEFRSLLIARKLSQLVAKTWIEPDKVADNNEMEKLEIIRKLILLGNNTPKWGSCEIEGEELLQETECDHFLEDESAVILPGMKNWQSIYLNLLLSGQVYWENKGKLELLNEPILSTYETVNLYAFQVVFDEFVSKAQELFSPGASPTPPYYLWTFPYPLRSRTDDFSELKPEMIEAWAYAKEDDNTLPFYRRDAQNEIVGVEYVYPPYPYMAGSH